MTVTVPRHLQYLVCRLWKVTCNVPRMSSGYWSERALPGQLLNIENAARRSHLLPSTTPRPGRGREMSPPPTPCRQHPTLSSSPTPASRPSRRPQRLAVTAPRRIARRHPAARAVACPPRPPSVRGGRGRYQRRAGGGARRITLFPAVATVNTRCAAAAAAATAAAAAAAAVERQLRSATLPIQVDGAAGRRLWHTADRRQAPRCHMQQPRRRMESGGVTTLRTGVGRGRR